MFPVAADRLLLRCSRLEIAPDQHAGEDQENRHDYCRNQYRIDGHSHLLLIWKQCTKLANASFDADQKLWRKQSAAESLDAGQDRKAMTRVLKLTAAKIEVRQNEG
jgi:hypothetical protein